MMQPSAMIRQQQPGMAMGPPSHAITSPPPPVAGGQPAFQGTLAPGTRVMIGPIIVTVQKYLSQGGFAHVYLVTTDKPIAMPISDTSTPGSTSSSTRGETLHVLKRMAVPDKEALASVRSEVEVHKSLRSHPNIVHFIEASATALQGGGYEIFILMEYCSGGGIIDLMNARLRNRLTEAEVLKIFGDVAAGLAIMHHMDPPLMHRDLKVENILLAPPPRSNPSVGPTYKLCDFGSSIPLLSRKAPKSVEEVKKLEADLNMHTTLQYRAPEMVDVYQRRIIDEKADVWAMGVLLYKLCYYTTPFEENGGGPLAILNVRYRFPQSPVYSQRLKDLIASMLQEQSTSRPTIDQVIIGVHSILGTKPPSSVVHYAKLAASGKQVQPLPSVVSSSSSTSMSGSNADVAARAMAKRSATNDSGPAAGVSKDLIEIAPSESERRSVEQEELKKRSEGIIPMRRGRPNRAPNQASSSTSSTAAAATITTLTSPTPSRGSSPIKASTAVPAQPSDHQFGFADSFSPPTRAASTLAPSRPNSAMHYSPSMPGMVPSNRASPLPPMSLSPAPPPTSKPSQQQDEEASSRFPSVEQLDIQYGTGHRSKTSTALPRSRTITIPTSLTSSPVPFSSSRTTVIPGLAERKPVSAMAGSFASNTTTNGKGTPPLASAPVSGRWTGISTSSSVAKRWPHQDSGSASNKVNLPSPRDSASPAPVLPSRKPYAHDWITEKGQQQQSIDAKSPSPVLPPRKPYLHDWLPENGKQQSVKSKSPNPLYPSASSGQSPASIDAEKIQEDSESSDDEVEKPEDVNVHVAPESKRHTFMDKSIYETRKESIAAKPTPAVPFSTKVKTPAWVHNQNEVNSSSIEAKPTPVSTSSEEQYPTRSTTIESTLSGTKLAAVAPAWDEDDEEMHFLPQPDLSDNQRYEQGRTRVSGVPMTIATQTKMYADASTSPGRNTPVSNSPATDRNPPRKQSSLIQSQASSITNEKNPPAVLSPKPIRSQSTKDVGGLVSRYQDSKGGSPEVKTTSGVVQQQKDTLTNGSESNPATSATGPPPVTASKPSLWTSTISRKESEDSSIPASRPAPKTSLKPWEKEAYEKEQVHKYGSLRSVSPDKRDSMISGEASGNHEAQERFSGVSSLISQWQTNSTKRAPGWGHVGGAGQDEQDGSSHPSNLTGRFKSKQEEDLLKRSSTISSATGRRQMQGRLSSREV